VDYPFSSSEASSSPKKGIEFDTLSNAHSQDEPISGRAASQRAPPTSEHGDQIRETTAGYAPESPAELPLIDHGGAAETATHLLQSFAMIRRRFEVACAKLPLEMAPSQEAADIQNLRRSRFRLEPSIRVSETPSRETTASSSDGRTSFKSDALRDIPNEPDHSKATHDAAFQKPTEGQGTDDESKHNTKSGPEDNPGPNREDKSCSGDCKECKVKIILRLHATGVIDVDAMIREIARLEDHEEAGELARERIASDRHPELVQIQRDTHGSNATVGHKQGRVSSRKSAGLTPPKKKVRTSTSTKNGSK
jgi:hypothetical protein